MTEMLPLPATFQPAFITDELDRRAPKAVDHALQ
jgi:hypothetical protein